jgi:hypothetical protein
MKLSSISLNIFKSYLLHNSNSFSNLKIFITRHFLYQKICVSGFISYDLINNILKLLINQRTFKEKELRLIKNYLNYALFYIFYKPENMSNIFKPLVFNFY